MSGWYHVIWNTLGSWLPGDPRGFRNRDHRIHSSGDYKKPPPTGEHANLLRFNKMRSRPTVKLSNDVRETIAAAILEFCERRDFKILAIAVGEEHVHILMKLVDEYEEAKKIIGKCKTICSGAVREKMPGSIWSRGAVIQIIDTKDYQLNVFRYITQRQEPGSWIWDFQRGGRWQT